MYIPGFSFSLVDTYYWLLTEASLEPSWMSKIEVFCKKR